MAGVERVSVHVSRLAHCPNVFFVEFSRAGSVGNLVVPLDRSEAEALRDELGEALSGRITEAAMMSLKPRCIYSSFLRCLKGLVCAITSLSPRRKEPNHP